MPSHPVILTEEHHTRRHIDDHDSARAKMLQSRCEKSLVIGNMFDHVEEEERVVVREKRGFQVQNVVEQETAAPGFGHFQACPAKIATIDRDSEILL